MRFHGPLRHTLKRLRDMHSTAEVAAKSGIPLENILAYEAGVAMPTAAVLRKIARACDLDLVQRRELQNDYVTTANLIRARGQWMRPAG